MTTEVRAVGAGTSAVIVTIICSGVSGSPPLLSWSGLTADVVRSNLMSRLNQLPLVVACVKVLINLIRSPAPH